MAGTIEWQALPLLAEMYGVIDVELLIVSLIALRDHQERVQNAGNT